MSRRIESGELHYTNVDALSAQGATDAFEDVADQPALVFTYGGDSDGDALVLYGNVADLIAFKQRVIDTVDEVIESGGFS